MFFIISLYIYNWYHCRGENKVLDLGAGRAHSLGNLGALMIICGPYSRNVKYFSIFCVLTPEISRGLSGP